MLLLPPVMQAPPTAPRTVTLAQALNALEQARSLEFAGKPPGREVLREHLEALGPAPAVLWKALGPRDPRALLARGLEAALGSRLGDETLEKAWARAAGQLQKGLAAAERKTGPRHPSLLPWLEALADLHRIQGLESQTWRERALRIRVAQARKADPALERACAEAVAVHYGPWLSFRPPDVPGMLDWIEALLDLWALERNAGARTARVYEAAFPARSAGVWRLTGRHGSPELMLRIRELLDGLQVEGLEPQNRVLADWVAARQAGPWKASADRLAARADAMLDKDPRPPAVLARVALALASGETDRAAAVLRGAMLDTDHGAAPEFLEAARMVLQAAGRGGMDPGLLDLALRRLLDPATRPKGELLLAWAELLEENGQLERAEALHRRHLALDPAQGRGLARNLRAQGRLEDAWALLEAVRLALEPAPPLDLLMEEMGLAKERGDAAAAASLARRAVDQWAAAGVQAALVPGLASVLEVVDGDSAEQAFGALQKVLDPDGQPPPERQALLEALRSQEATSSPRALERAVEALEREGRLASRQGARLLVSLGAELANEDPEAALERLRQATRAAAGAKDMKPGDWIFLRSHGAAIAFMAGREKEGESLLAEALEALEDLGPEEKPEKALLEAAAVPFLQSWERLVDQRRYDPAQALLARLRRVVRRMARSEEILAELDAMETRATRLERLQGLLQAEGLP